MLEWLKEMLIGLGCLAGLWLLAILYNLFTQLANEDTELSKVVRKLSKVCGRTLLVYIAVCYVIGLIAGIIILFT